MCMLYLRESILSDNLLKELYTCVMYLYTPYLYHFMSLSPAGVSGYRRRKGYCSVFEDSIRHLKTVKTPQECAKQCSAETRCKTFQYLDGSKYEIKCVLKTKVCKKPATDVKGGYIYTRRKSAEPETVE